MRITSLFIKNFKGIDEQGVRIDEARNEHGVDDGVEAEEQHHADGGERETDKRECGEALREGIVLRIVRGGWNGAHRFRLLRRLCPSMNFCVG